MKILDSLKLTTYRLSMQGLAKGPHITRYTMYRQLARLGPLMPKGGKALSISHSTGLLKITNASPSSITEANYPDTSLTSLPFSSEQFDIVVSDQVLEHVEGDPQIAINEAFRVLKQGGVAVHTTCFINPIHAAPNDLWRFSCEGLRYLARNASEVIDCDGWGNFEAWKLIRLGLRYDGVPHAEWHPLHRIATQNDPEWPIVTWIVARK